MRAALILLGLFAVAVAFALAARIDHGYVIVVYPPWRMEMSFLLALALLAALIGLAYLLLRLATTALRLPGDMRDWRAKRRRAAADKFLMEAMRAHLEGDQTKAGKLAGKAAGCSAPDVMEKLKLASRPNPPAQASD